MPLFDGITFECCRVSKLEHAKITQLVEENGGRMGLIDLPLTFMPPEKYDPVMDRKIQAYDIKFIKTCAKKGKLVRLQNFRLGPSKPLERCVQSFFLTGRCKYKELVENLRKSMADSDSSTGGHDSRESLKRRVESPSASASPQKKIRGTLEPSSVKRESSVETGSFVTAPSGMTIKTDEFNGSVRESAASKTSDDELSETPNSPAVRSPKKSPWIAPSDDWMKNDKVANRLHPASEYIDRDDGRVALLRTCATNSSEKIALPKSNEANSSEKIALPKSNAANSGEKIALLRSNAASSDERVALLQSSPASSDEEVESTRASASNGVRNASLCHSQLLRNPFSGSRTRGKLTIKVGTLIEPTEDGETIDGTAIDPETSVSSNEQNQPGIVNCNSDDDDDDDKTSVLEFARIPCETDSCVPGTKSREAVRTPPENRERALTLSPISPISSIGDEPGPSGVQSAKRSKIIVISEPSEEEDETAGKLTKLIELDKRRQLYKKERAKLEENVDLKPESRHMRFTQSERQEMVKYLCTYDDIEQVQPKGLKIWNRMLQKGLLRHRTGKSLQNHFAQSILPHIEDYFGTMTENQKEQFLRVRASTRS